MDDAKELDAPIGPVTRSKRSKKEQGESIVEAIVEKRETRRQTYYKVKPFLSLSLQNCYSIIVNTGALAVTAR